MAKKTRQLWDGFRTCFRPPVSVIIGSATAIYCGLGFLGVLSSSWPKSAHWWNQVAGVFLIATAIGTLWNLVQQGGRS